MSLRIGIDGYNFAIPHGTGIATYGFVLARTLQMSGGRVDGLFGLDTGSDPKLREVMFFDQLDRDQGANRTRRQFRREQRMLTRLALSPWARRGAVPVPMTTRVDKTAFSQRLPAFDRLFSLPHLFEIAHRHFKMYGRLLPIRLPDPPDVMHWTYPVPVRLLGTRNVYTFHDLIPLKLPYTTLDAKRFYRKMLSACIDAADHICTVSEASRVDIIDEFAISADKVTNTYQASPMAPTASLCPDGEDAAKIEGIFGLGHRRYYLFFGAIEPKKNLGRLIEAYLGLDLDIPLVIVGSRAWQSEGELTLLANLAEGGAKRVIRLEYLSRSLLTQLVRGARAVLFPSLYEGFGLPLLEAMQLGTPVLTSDRSSMPEIGADAVVYCDPYDPASISAALKRLNDDPTLRDALSRRGIARAEMFSPEQYRQRLTDMYVKALS